MKRPAILMGLLGGSLCAAQFNVPVEKFRLDNGMKVVLSAATFTGVMQVRNEVLQPAIQSMLNHRKASLPASIFCSSRRRTAWRARLARFGSRGSRSPTWRTT
jgi:hypothetical protein